MSTKKLYVGAQNDSIYIIDKQPHPAPLDQVLPGGDTNVIAVMTGSDDSAIALARKLAAAPDLYEALRGLLSATSSPFDEDGAWKQMVDEAYARAEAALAKAEGKEG